MYPQYPTTSPIDTAPPPVVPSTVSTAVKAMYIGAVGSVVTAVADIATEKMLRYDLEHSIPRQSSATINVVLHEEVVLSIVLGVVSVALWLVVAHACKKGKTWGRTLASVLFALSTLSHLAGPVGLRLHGASAAVIVGLLEWLVGLVAIVYLWLPTSRTYFELQTLLMRYPPGAGPA